MGDNLKRYRAIKEKLFQLYPTPPTGRLAQSLTVLAMFINGIVASGSTHLRHVAKKTPTGSKVTSREKQLSRWCQNGQVRYAVHMLPFVRQLLAGLAPNSLLLVIDGSEIGRQCLVLMVSVVYQRRTLPLMWHVVQGSKGHFPAEVHVQLLRDVQALVPPGVRVVLLGDGEFDTVELQGFLRQSGWDYVCRTAKSTCVCQHGEWLKLAELDLARGACLALPDVLFSHQAFGPVQVILQWDPADDEPLYLVTNLELVQEACRLYARRMRIETFFSDQKSRGFALHKSHIHDPTRLSRLLIAACLAYIWIIYLGVYCLRQGFQAIIHRTHRCDLSLFQLGLDCLEYLLNEDKPIPVGFKLKYAARSSSNKSSVR
jgi:hypothetical protein